MRDERRPGTRRCRRSTCGCGAHGHSADEHAFQPKWWSSSPMFGRSRRLAMLPEVEDAGCRAANARASGRVFAVVPVVDVTDPPRVPGGALAALPREGG